MNGCTRNFSLVLNEIKKEAYQFQFYLNKRVKDITFIIDSNRKLPLVFFGCGASFLGALAVHSLSLTAFIVFSSLLLDYFNKTYFYKQLSNNSTSFYHFALGLQFQSLEQSFEPLPSEVIELISDPELIPLLYEHNEEIRRKKLEDQKDSRPILLIMQAESDFNGALNLCKKDNVITINGDNEAGLQKLKEKYKVVLMNHLKDIDAINAGLEKINNEIHHLWIFSHGTPSSMLLNGQNKIVSSNIDLLSDSLQKKLSKDAHVVLYSCSTGKKIKEQENIATSVSRILPGRVVWAPEIPTALVKLNLMDDGSSNVKFLKKKSRLRFVLEKIFNICTCRPFKKIKSKWNVTSQIKNGKEVVAPL